MAVNRPEYLAGQVEVTSKCFQACLGCDSWREDLKGQSSGEWTLQQLRHFVTDLRTSFPNFHHLSLTGGDPQAWEPLEEFLEWRSVDAGSVRIQLNTALTQPVANIPLWRNTIDDFRVSLDGVTEETYNRIRGKRRPEVVNGKRTYVEGAATTPEAVIERMIRLQHPRLTTNTTVFHENVHEARTILLRLIKAAKDEGLLIRKAHFMAAIGDRGPRDVLQHAFLEEWKALHELAASAPFETNIAESPLAVRQYLRDTREALDIPCYTGSISFHVKCNGDLYPCCLVGGEALETQKAFRIGNVHETPIKLLHAAYRPCRDYQDESKPCRSICQWKQLQVNAAGYWASKADVLAMP